MELLAIKLEGRGQDLRCIQVLVPLRDPSLNPNVCGLHRCLRVGYIDAKVPLEEKIFLWLLGTRLKTIEGSKIFLIVSTNPSLQRVVFRGMRRFECCPRRFLTNITTEKKGLTRPLPALLRCRGTCCRVFMIMIIDTDTGHHRTTCTL
jgi:hypothetical protein